MELLFFLFREIQSAATLLPILGLFIIRSYLLPAEAVSQCVDADKDCAQWVHRASSGCDDWLKLHCELSCSMCRPLLAGTSHPQTVSSDLPFTQFSCYDHNLNCANWARTGQCLKNAKYMSVVCCRECRTVENRFRY